MNGPAMVTGFFRRSESNESSFFRREAFKELKQRRINLECVLFFSGATTFENTLNLFVAFEAFEANHEGLFLTV